VVQYYLHTGLIELHLIVRIQHKDNNNCNNSIPDRQCMYDIISRNIHIIIVAMEKAMSVTYFECVCVAPVIQHAECMSHNI
jgi:hypothetical protein